MDNLYEWIHDDKTWCVYDECPYLECERNIANRLTKNAFISLADFRDTAICMINVKGDKDKNA